MSVRILATYTRVFVDAKDLDSTSSFYQALLGGKESLRFAHPGPRITLAAVSSANLSVLIIAGSSENRLPFEGTRLTIKVEALEPAIAVLRAYGAEQLEPIQATPVGRKTRFRHADGIIVEYVENNVSNQS